MRLRNGQRQDTTHLRNKAVQRIPIHPPGKVTNQMQAAELAGGVPEANLRAERLIVALDYFLRNRGKFSFMGLGGEKAARK